MGNVHHAFKLASVLYCVYNYETTLPNPLLDTNARLIVDATAVFSGFLGGDGDVWLSNVMCMGNETEIINCSADPLGPQSCVGGHSADAGVRCRGKN